MINYPIYSYMLVFTGIALFFLLRFIWEKYRLLRYGFRTTARVVRLVGHCSGQVSEFGYIPIVEFRDRNGELRVVKTVFFLERFVTKSKIQLGYEFDIIYRDDDITGMIEITTLKEIIIIYTIVTLFPAAMVLLLVAGLFY